VWITLMDTSPSGDDPSFYPLEVNQPSRFGGIIHPKDVGAAGLPVQHLELSFPLNSRQPRASTLRSICDPGDG
jgi:hypothetical protein